MGNNQKSESQLKAEAQKPQPIYGAVRFGIPATRQVNDRFNRVSCKMLDAFVPIIGTGLVICSAIYAGLERKGDGVSIVPSAYLPSKQIKPETEGASDAFLSHVENAAMEWNGYDAALAAATAALLGHVDPSAAKLLAPTGKVNRPVMARLVGKDGQTVAVAPVPAS